MTALELKIAFRQMREEMRVLKERVDLLEARPSGGVLTRQKMCPKCGEKPAYHFHVVNCSGKEEKQT
jgi:ribosomal protein S27AE